MCHPKPGRNRASQRAAALAGGFAVSQWNTCAWPCGLLHRGCVASSSLNLISEPMHYSLWHLRTFQENKCKLDFFLSLCWRLSPFDIIVSEVWQGNGDTETCLLEGRSLSASEACSGENISHFLEVFQLIFSGEILSNTEATWLLHNLTLSIFGAWVWACWWLALQPSLGSVFSLKWFCKVL